MNSKVYLLPFFMLLLVLGVSCSKDEDPEPRNFETIGFNSEEVLAKLPPGLLNSEDEYAQTAVDDIESALDWSGFYDNFTPPDDAVKEGTDSYSWHWNYAGDNLTLWWEYDSDSQKNYWEMDIQYNEGDRYDYLDAWESKDGKSGEIKYNFEWACSMDENPEECEKLYWIYSWNLNSNGDYTFTYLVEADEEEYSAFMSYTVIINNDGSGSIEYYFYDELFYNITWDSEGNGSWTYYFGDTEMSGNWTVD
jgi:hypothetical protein